MTHINLNDTGSNKETYHIEIDAEGVSYEPGDSIGIIPENKIAIVEKIIAITGIDATTNIDYKDELISVAGSSSEKIKYYSFAGRVVKKYASVVEQEIPVTRIDLVDLLKIYPVSR